MGAAPEAVTEVLSQAVTFEQRLTVGEPLRPAEVSGKNVAHE